MGIFDKLIQKQVNKQVSAIHELQLKSLNVLRASFNNSMFALYGNLKYDVTNSDTLYTILRKRNQKEASIPLYVYKKKAERKNEFKKYLALTKGAVNSLSFQNSINYRVKAMDEVIVDNDLTRLIQRPNFSMGADAFWQGVFYQYSLGECFLRKNRGGGKGKPVELELLNSKSVEIVTVGNTTAVSYYNYHTGVGMQPIEKDDMIHWKSYNPADPLRGFDPLLPLKKRLEQDNALTDAAMFASKNSGAAGALMPKQIENFNAEQKTQIEDTINGVANNSMKSKAVGFLPAPFDYVNFGRTADEMQLLEQLGWTFERICHLFGVPPEIFLSDQTFSNKEWAQKNWITNDVMPVLYSLRDELNRSLVPEFDTSLFIDADFTTLPEMQEDMKKLLDGLTPLFDRGGLTQDELRTIAGFEATGNPLHQKYYISGSYAPLDDMGEMPAQEAIKNHGDY